MFASEVRAYPKDTVWPYLQALDLAERACPRQNFFQWGISDEEKGFQN